MLQAHYITDGFDVLLARVVPDLERQGLIKEKEDMFRFKHTYYDSGSKTLLKRGGYCRKNIRFDFDRNIPPKVLIEYRPHKKSHTRRYISEEEMPLEELTKILGFNHNLKRLVKFQGHQLTLSFRMRDEKNGYAPHLDFIVQLGEILNPKTGKAKKVSVVSLVDTTANEYNVSIANYLSYKTERVISRFEKIMSDLEYEKLSSDRYGEMFERVPVEGDVERYGDDPVFSGEKRFEYMDLAKMVFKETDENGYFK